MGMFDYITCHYPLPGQDFNIVWPADDPFQTKSFECMMEDYTITEDGRIIHHTVRYETVPDEERPYYGTEKWETGFLAKFCGAMRSVSTGDVYLDLTDTIRFYSSKGREWFEYSATFVNGKLIDIRRINIHTFNTP